MRRHVSDFFKEYKNDIISIGVVSAFFVCLLAIHSIISVFPYIG